jgi:hypothetical protein
MRKLVERRAVNGGAGVGAGKGLEKLVVRD